MIFNPDNPKEHEEYNRRKKEFDALPLEQRLRKIAEMLNRGEKVDCGNTRQAKCYLAYDHYSRSITQLTQNQAIKTQGTIYCLSGDFLLTTLKWIDVNELENYLKNY